MSRIGLVNLVPLTDVANYLGFNQGIGSLSAVLKGEGHDVRMFTFSSGNDEMGALQGFDPDALFVYLATHQYRLFLDLLERVWRPMGVRVFVGGPHPTVCPGETARIEGVSGVCIGEGENAGREIAGRVAAGASVDRIPNVWFSDGDGSVAAGETGDYVADLDTLPFPDRDIFPYDRMLKSRAIRLMGFEFLATRGCIYSCRYCINPALRRIHGKGCVRRRSVEHFVEEIEQVVQKYDYRGIVGMHDDIFTLDLPWLHRFAERYGNRVGLPFWCNAHIAEISEEVVVTLRRAGCFRIHVGIECGNERIRRQVLGKKIANDEIMEKVRLLRSHHMKIVATFMVGLPDEEEPHLLETIALCREMAPDWVLLSTFCPYPGTRLYDSLTEEGRLDPEFYAHLGSDTFYSADRTYDGQRIAPERLDYYFRNFRGLAQVPGAV